MRKSKKTDYLLEFLDYGGSELFSSLVCFADTRADAENRLTELLKIYTDNLRIRKSKGRSGAYRFLIAKAAQKGWVGKKPDLYKSKLSDAEREHIISNVTAYINSGGFTAIILKKSAFVAAVICVFAVFFVKMYRYVTSEEYYKKTAAYFASGITVGLSENPKNDKLEFSIVKNGEIVQVYMDKAPKIYKNGRKVSTFSGYCLDEEWVFTETEESFFIPLGIYDCNFDEGDFKAVFEFEILTVDGKKKSISNIVCEFTIDS